MTLIVPLPWCRRPWALLFLTVLSPSKKSNEKAGRRHKTSIDWTRQMVKLVSRWLHGASWVLLGGGAYACMALAQAYARGQTNAYCRKQHHGTIKMESGVKKNIRIHASAIARNNQIG